MTIPDWRLVFQRILKDAEKWNLQSSSYTAKVAATLSVTTEPCTVALPPTENKKKKGIRLELPKTSE